MADWIIVYYVLTTVISIFICCENWEFTLNYFNYKEWTIKHLLGLPFILGILTILFLAFTLLAIFTLLEKLEPIMNKRLFK